MYLTRYNFETPGSIQNFSYGNRNIVNKKRSLIISYRVLDTLYVKEKRSFVYIFIDTVVLNRHGACTSSGYKTLLSYTKVRSYKLPYNF